MEESQIPVHTLLIPTSGAGPSLAQSQRPQAVWLTICRLLWAYPGAQTRKAMRVLIPPTGNAQKGPSGVTEIETQPKAEEGTKEVGAGGDRVFLGDGVMKFSDQ